MIRATYPSRPAAFAPHFIRELRKAEIPMEVGAAGAWLLSVIVDHEDRLDYRKAPEFVDHELQHELGGVDQKTLARLRNKCVDVGWLHYEPGAKGRAARYFVVIPSSFRSEQ